MTAIQKVNIILQTPMSLDSCLTSHCQREAGRAVLQDVDRRMARHEITGEFKDTWNLAVWADLSWPCAANRCKIILQ